MRYIEPAPLILIVDDTLQNIQVLGRILREANYRIAVATNGEEGIKAAVQEKPDLILLDVMMPVLDGFAAAAQLKTQKSTRDIPIIFLTAKVEPEDLIQGFDLGAVDYVTKPFHPKELLIRVRTHLELCQSRKIIQEQSQNQKELLHILCHDLANSFSGFRGMLLITEDLETFLELKPSLLQAAQNSLDIINLVRKIRAIEENKISIELSSYNLSQLVDTSVQMLKPRWQEKQISFSIQIPTDLKVQVEEVSFVNSVLNNLLTNSIKFSYAGSQVDIKAETQEGRVWMEIQDRGIGMSPQLCQDIFDLSKVTHRPGTEGEDGVGFGMPLIKKFVTLYQGEIEASSKDEANYPQERGTTFTLILNQG